MSTRPQLLKSAALNHDRGLRLLAGRSGNSGNLPFTVVSVVVALLLLPRQLLGRYLEVMGTAGHDTDTARAGCGWFSVFCVASLFDHWVDLCLCVTCEKKSCLSPCPALLRRNGNAFRGPGRARPERSRRSGDQRPGGAPLTPPRRAGKRRHASMIVAGSWTHFNRFYHTFAGRQST